MEIWKPIAGFEGYEISNYGRYRNASNHRILKPELHKQTGYLRITFPPKKRKKHRKVHRLVADAFIPNPQNKTQVNHIDGDKTNNHYSNLEWSTPQENILHSIDMGVHHLERFMGKFCSKSQ